MFCFNEFAFTVQVKHKINSIQILGFNLICLYFTTAHFHTCVLCKECSLFLFEFLAQFSATVSSFTGISIIRGDAHGGSTLGRGREGPSKLWLGPKFSRTLGTFYIMVRYCIKTAKGIHCGELILRKVSKFYATRCQILRLKCTKFDFRWGYAPDSSGGSYSAPLRPLAVFKGAYF